MEAIEKYPVEIIQGEVGIDNRGTVRFVNDFNFPGVKRFYQVENYERGFIRAWHGHKKETKYVYVAKGSIMLGVISMDVIQRTTHTIILNSIGPRICKISPNNYNGFKTLEEGTIVFFFSDTTIEEAADDDFRYPADYFNDIFSWDIVQR